MYIFTPRFNYRATHYMAMNGFYNFLNWFDERAWYPLGRIVGGTVYPGLMVTSGFIHWLLNSLHFPIHIRDVCVFLAPMFRWVLYRVTQRWGRIFYFTMEYVKNFILSLNTFTNHVHCSNM